MQLIFKILTVVMLFLAIGTNGFDFILQVCGRHDFQDCHNVAFASGDCYTFPAQRIDAPGPNGLDQTQLGANTLEAVSVPPNVKCFLNDNNNCYGDFYQVGGNIDLTTVGWQAKANSIDCYKM